MGQYISNGRTMCPYCGSTINEGRERSTPLPNKKILIECIWVCERCGMVARRDEREENAE